MKLKLNQIHNVDCLEFMKTIPDDYFDLIITDPPYGINADKNQYNAGGKAGWREYNDQIKWDEFKPTKEYFDEMKRVSKNQII